MKMVVFHLNNKSCADDIMRVKRALVQYGIKVTSAGLAGISEHPKGILVVTDSAEEAELAKKKNIAVIFFEESGRDSQVSGVDMVVQGFEEVDVQFLQLVYKRHHGLPWIIAETEHLYIRESVEEDLEAFCSMYREKGITDYIPEPELEGEEGRLRFCQYIRNMYRFYNYGIWTVIEKRTGEIIGRAGIENGEYQGKSILELGYMIGKKWQRRGFGREAALASAKFAKEVLGTHSLYAFIYPQNTASIRLIRQIGFERMQGLTENGLSVWKKSMTD
mgnify:CR=1 FL=1